MKELTDDDEMPFGKYEGDAMADVPADYLHYLWTELGFSEQNKPVSNYIRRNLEALKKEHPDGEWD